jgi:hypothetical protein
MRSRAAIWADVGSSPGRTRRTKAARRSFGASLAAGTRGPSAAITSSIVTVVAWPETVAPTRGSRAGSTAGLSMSVKGGTSSGEKKPAR